MLFRSKSFMKKRLDYIDFVRAIGILGVIAIHTFSYNLTSPINNFIWNYLHFVVVAFVFCSGYVLTYFYKNSFPNFSTTLLWYKKRILRLLIPFYSYLLIHFALFFLFPQFFSGLDLKKSWDFFFKSVFLTGGVGIGWLPLLFLQLTLLFPIFLLLFKKRILLISYIIFASLTALFFTIQTFPYSYYKYVMWIPWSLILIFSMYAAFNEPLKQKLYVKIAVVSGIVFLFLTHVLSFHHKSLSLIDYKYPPSLYYLSYATFMSSLLILLCRTFLSKYLVSFWNFVSKNSYQLFFIHLIVLDFTLSLKKYIFILNYVFLEIIFVIGIALVISFVLEKLKKLNLLILRSIRRFR